MPYEGEERTQDGRQEVYFEGEWHPVKQRKQTTEKEYPIDVELKIGSNTYRGKARTEKFKWETENKKKGTKTEHERKGFAVKLNEGQTAYGGGNIFLRI
jgi:hypothetical protein